MSKASIIDADEPPPSPISNLESRIDEIKAAIVDEDGSDFKKNEILNPVKDLTLGRSLFLPNVN